MPYGMYLSAEGAKVQAKRLEFIANNLANLNTPGFKRDVPTFQARFAEAIQQGADTPGSRSVNDVGGGVKLMEVETDHSRGTLRHTSLPTDFAINGDGYFQVQAEDGEMLLTRAGDFQLDAQGRLLTQNGLYQVLDDEGRTVQLDPLLPWQFHSRGLLEQNGETVSLGLQQPASLGDLVKVGHNMFRSLAPTTTVPEAERDVRQGYLEQSGVSSIREMNAMIETTRAFEANTKIIQHQDSMLSSLINRTLAR